MHDINKNIHEMMQELQMGEDEVTTELAEDDNISQRTYTGSSNMNEGMMAEKSHIRADWANKVNKDEIAPKDDSCCLLF